MERAEAEAKSVLRSSLSLSIYWIYMYVYDSVIVLKPKTDAVQLQYTYSKLYKVKIIIKRNPTNRETRDTLKDALREFKTVKKKTIFSFL